MEGIFEAKELCSQFTTDVVATCAYGVDGNAIKDPDSEFRRMGRATINPGLLGNIKFVIGFIAPQISNLLKLRFLPMKVENFFIRMVKEVIQYREENNVSRNDYLQHLISIKKKTENEPSEKYHIAAGATTFFIDGFETSAGVLSFMLYCLACNSEVQEKLREEISKATKENGGALDYDSIHKLPYLDMVFSESMRMFPPVTFMKRLCTKKITLQTSPGEELTMEEGATLVIPVYGIHNDPKYYPDPHLFIPERFTEENKNNRHKKFEGHRYAGIFELGNPSLFIRDPELIKDVLVREFSKFHDNEIFVDPDSDAIWKVTRSRLMPAFTVAKLKPLFPLVQGVCDELNKVISNDKKGIFEAKELSSQFTTDVVATCAYGIDGNALKDPDSEFRRMGRATIDPGLLGNIKFIISIMTPKIFDMLKLSSRVYDLGIKTFDDIDIAAGATTFFLDGFETSAGVLSFNLYCLACNPEVQEKLRQEISNATKENGGALDYDSIQKLPYLDMVFSESLRMFPPVVFIKRMCTKKTAIQSESGKELIIDEGDSMIIPIYSIHNDPKYYPDPHLFIPERFTEENKNSRHKYVYLPFGEGPRTCLGMRFAIMQVKAAIVNIVSKFEIKTTDRTPIPLVASTKSIFLGAKDGLWLQIVPLKNN
ncbi:hypothetical protein C0J52_03712 [Blattella germanica]|nr:hypothetical protein C0J52_03712 [Blattella germanica]